MLPGLPLEMMVQGWLIGLHVRAETNPLPPMEGNMTSQVSMQL